MPEVATPAWLQDLRNRARRWDQRHAARALRRLDEERQRLRHDVRMTNREISRVEGQMALLQDREDLEAGAATETTAFLKKKRLVDSRLQEAAADSSSVSSSSLSPLPASCNLRWLVSGIVNGVLKLIFCIVFASLIVDAAPDLLQDSLPILVGTQLASALVTCLFTARYSTVGASVAGPDIIHALVLKSMTQTVAKLVKDAHPNDPEAAAAACLATVLFLVCFSSFLISLTWLAVARYRLMVVIDFFPISVVTGFLGCIGYKVVKEAIRVSVGQWWYFPGHPTFWRLLVPSIPVGVPMYLLKRFHIGSPLVSLTFYIFVPLAVFFIAVAGCGKSLEDLRGVDQGWLPDPVGQGHFYEQWAALDFSLVRGDAVLSSLPDCLVLIVVITLEAFLYLSTTKQELKLKKMDMIAELYVLGWQNLLSTLCVGSVGYSQLKFNSINYAITKDTDERRPTVVVGLLCGVLWFVGFPLINLLPRFFLGGLLISAGLPFVELVVLAYNRVTKTEFVCMWVIILINAIAGLKEVSGAVAAHSLLIAVIAGCVLSAFGFIYQYARVSVVRDTLSGQDFQSAVVRPYAEQRLVERLGKRYAVIELEGYIFFGSAGQIVNLARRIAMANTPPPSAAGDGGAGGGGKKQTDPFASVRGDGGAGIAYLPTCQRLRYIAIDFAHVENIDNSGAIAFRDVRDMLREAGIVILFTALNRKVRRKLAQEGVLSASPDEHDSKASGPDSDGRGPSATAGHPHFSHDSVASLLGKRSTGVMEFVDLDFASEYVERCLLERAAYVRGYWLLYDSFRKLHTQAVLKATYEIFEAVLGEEVGNRLWRYAEQVKFKAGELLCEEGRYNHTLYLLQSGSVTTLATGSGAGSGKSDGWLANTDTDGTGDWWTPDGARHSKPTLHRAISLQFGGPSRGEIGASGDLTVANVAAGGSRKFQA